MRVVRHLGLYQRLEYCVTSWIAQHFNILTSSDQLEPMKYLSLLAILYYHRQSKEWTGNAGLSPNVADATSVIRSDTLYFGILYLQIYSRTLYLHILNKNGNVDATIGFSNFFWV